MRLIGIAILAATFPAAAQAAERNYSVTSFDRVVVTGPYAVTVKTGSAPSARVAGSVGAIDALSVDQTGETLAIRGNGSSDAASAHGPIAVTLTTPSLARVSLAGSGSVAVDRLSGDRPAASLAGSGTLRIGRVEGDHVGITMAGSGSLAIAGRAAVVGVMVQGTGSLDAGDLAAEDLAVTATGSGSVRAAASRTATVNADGAVVVDIAGRPACTVRTAGSASVSCGASTPG